MSDHEKTPKVLEDADLDGASGGGNLGRTYFDRKDVKATTILYDEDGNVSGKVLIASASGSGNALGGDPSGNKPYTFDEEIDGEFVPVTYKLEG